MLIHIGYRKVRERDSFVVMAGYEKDGDADLVRIGFSLKIHGFQGFFRIHGLTMTQQPPWLRQW